MRIDFRSRSVPEAEYELSGARYENNRLALVLRTKRGEPVGTLSVNLPQNPMTDDEVAIRDHNENHGTLTSLVEAEIVENPYRWVSSGYVLLPICKLARVGKEINEATPKMETKR